MLRYSCEVPHVPTRQNASRKSSSQLNPDLRSDGRRKRRPPLAPTARNSIDAGAAFCFGDARSAGMLAGRKESTRKLYRDGYEAFRRFMLDVNVDPAVDGWNRLPPNGLAAFYRWALDHRRGGLSVRTASSYAYAVSALLRQLLIEGRLPAAVSLEKLRLGLREALARGDYLRRKVDPRIDDFIAWVAEQPIPPPEDGHNSAHLEALRARALVLTLYCSGLRREEVTALETAEVLGGAEPGEADVRGKGDRERTVFLDAAALEAIRSYVQARGPADNRPWVFVSHGNRRRRNDRLSPWSVWNIVKTLARRAEVVDPRFSGLTRTLHTHDTRHNFARTVLNAGAGLSVVQDLLGHASPATTKRIYATSDRAVLRSAARAHAPHITTTAPKPRRRSTRNEPS
jgi:integrase